MSDILNERAGNVLSVQQNRPTKKNGMTSSMYIALAEAFEAAAKDDQVRVVLWHAVGDTFSAGNDLEDFVEHPPGPGESPQARLVHALMALEKPVVAAVRGTAIGGGTTLLGHCDFVYAAENTRFQLPFVNLGLVPEFGSSYLLPLRLGHLRAAELVLGQPFDAWRAAELGLVTKVVPDAGLLDAAMEAARTLAAKPPAAKPPAAVQASKRLLKNGFREQVEQAVKMELDVFAQRVRSDEAKEAFQAFLARRRPASHPG